MCVFVILLEKSRFSMEHILKVSEIYTFIVFCKQNLLVEFMAFTKQLIAHIISQESSDFLKCLFVVIRYNSPKTNFHEVCFV